MKKCNKCGDTKPLSEFHKNKCVKDGHTGHCKECQKVIAKAWRTNNPDREKSRIDAWHEANPERKAATYKVWCRANREHIIGTVNNWRGENPEKKSAHEVVRKAIYSGTLVRQPCEVCGNPDVHGHHDDYSKPLAVRWLCHKHHNEYHAQQRRDRATFYSYPVSYALDPAPFYAYPETVNVR